MFRLVLSLSANCSLFVLCISYLCQSASRKPRLLFFTRQVEQPSFLLWLADTGAAGANHISISVNLCCQTYVSPCMQTSVENLTLSTNIENFTCPDTANLDIEKSSFFCLNITGFSLLFLSLTAFSRAGMFTYSRAEAMHRIQPYFGQH